MKTTVKSAKKKRSVVKKEEYMTYIIEVIGSQTAYSISVYKNKKTDPGRYREIAFLECTGTLIYPEKLNGTTIECTISGDRQQIDCIQSPGENENYNVNLVGVLNVRKDRSDYFGWVPFDVWPHICQMFHVGELKYLNLHGEVLHRNKSGIHSMHFQKIFNPEEDV